MDERTDGENKRWLVVGGGGVGWRNEMQTSHGRRENWENVCLAAVSHLSLLSDLLFLFSCLCSESILLLSFSV